VYCTYAEEANDAANKVSQRKRSGIIYFVAGVLLFAF
jgi:hypothetical protein